MKKIFITGGTGFIGSAVINSLIQKDDNILFVLTRKSKQNSGQVHYIQGDISNEKSVRAAIQQTKPDILIHLAWNVKSINYTVSLENYKWIEWSEMISKIFLENGGKIIIGGGTCYEYKFSSCRDLLTEDSHILKPETLYGQCKLKTYDSLKRLCENYQAKIIWGRIFYPYGPGEEGRKLISSVRRQLLKNQNFICNSPNNIVDYIHINDVAEIFKLFVDNNEIYGVVNVCTGRGNSIRDILLLLAKQIGKMEYLNFGTDKYKNYIVGSNQKLLALNFKYKYNLINGLKTYAEIFL
jgi:Nucleoside-diphosphate-sugar epimerases